MTLTLVNREERMRRGHKLFLSLVAICYAACGQGEALSGSQKGSTPPAQAERNAGSSPEMQLGNEIMRQYTQCGDSVYSLATTYKGLVTEYKDFNITIETREVTKADSLNGVEWVGSYKRQFSAYRESFNGGPWNEWRTGYVEAVGTPVKKKAGAWQGIVQVGTAISCSDIPNKR